MSIPTDPNRSSLRHFWTGFAPAASAILILLIQALQPFVSHQQQGLLLTVADWLVSVSLAVWVWCVVKAATDRFEERDRVADERQEEMQDQADVNHDELVRMLRHQDAAIQSLHGRLQEMNQRHTALDRRVGETEAAAELLDERIKKGEQRYAALAVRMAGAETETEHLRALVLGVDLADAGSQQAGPRLVRLADPTTRWPRAGGDRPGATVISHGPQGKAIPCG